MIELADDFHLAVGSSWRLYEGSAHAKELQQNAEMNQFESTTH